MSGNSIISSPIMENKLITVITDKEIIIGFIFGLSILLGLTTKKTNYDCNINVYI